MSPMTRWVMSPSWKGGHRSPRPHQGPSSRHRDLSGIASRSAIANLGVVRQIGVHGGLCGPGFPRSASTRNPAAVSPNQAISWQIWSEFRAHMAVGNQSVFQRSGTGSREENASKQEFRARSDLIGTEKALTALQASPPTISPTPHVCATSGIDRIDWRYPRKEAYAWMFRRNDPRRALLTKSGVTIILIGTRSRPYRPMNRKTGNHEPRQSTRKPWPGGLADFLARGFGAKGYLKG